MSEIRFAVIDGTYHVHNIVMAPPSFAQYWYYIPSDTAQLGDFYNGTTFVTPPPPVPGRADMSGMLGNYLSNKEQIRREAILDSILDGQPAPQTFQAFLDMLAIADPT